jgi:hypothetical protein
VITSQIYKNNATGETQDLLLQHPKLTSDAIPTIFNKLPSYLSTVLPTKRKSPETRRKETQKRHAEDIKQFLKNDIIHNYDDFLKVFPTHLSTWNFKICGGLVWFYTLNIDAEAVNRESFEL